MNESVLHSDMSLSFPAYQGMAPFAISPVAAICFVFASALCSLFGWTCFLLGLNYGSWEIGMVCGSDGMQACGQPDLSLPRLASLCFMVLAGLNLPHWGVFPQILLLA